MDAYVVEWLSMLGRWAHFVTGIAWIGSSFYFIWLDNHLQAPAAVDKDAGRIAGELWSVHGGGFYHAQKYRVAPAVIPETLHWFKWEAYTTWITGMFLLALIYWYGAEVYLVDPARADLAAPLAITVAAAFIAGGWVVYDLVCRSPLGQNENLLAFVLLLLSTVLAWALCQLFSGRGAYIHYGAVLGTIMVANVFFIIIPAQRRMVAAAKRGEAPDPAPGLRAKQRSVHNTYFTLPVLFVMISNHYALTYSHEYNWLLLIAFSLAGALIRVYFVARHRGPGSPLPLVLALGLLLAVAIAIAPQARETSATKVTFADIQPIIMSRCSSCHSEQPSHPAFPAAPAGVVLDTREQIMKEAARIHQQTVVLKVMPIGNLTSISDAERTLLDQWYRGMGSPE